MSEILITNLTAKTTPVDADETILVDSAASMDNKKVTWGNVKAAFKTYFDTLYLSISSASSTYLPLATYDANTILAATTDNTPVALTIGTNTVVGRVAGNITTLAVDADLTSVSASDDTVPSAKATKTYADLKAPIASPTFTGTVTSPITNITGLQTNSAAINESKGADIASASTTDIGAATGNYVNVTGTTTITGLGTIQAGTRRIVNFTGNLTLTHNATSLILPTSANIGVIAGDVAHFVSLGSGNWKCIAYTRLDGTALASSGGAGSGTTGRQSITSSVTGTTVFAHGLGRAPVAVDFSGYHVSGGNFGSCAGSWSSGQNNGGMVANATSVSLTTGAVVIGDDPVSNRNVGAVSVDATNITLTWTKTGSPGSVWGVVWSAR